MKGKAEEHIKKRKDELQAKQKYLAELNSALERINNEIRSTREIIVFLTGAIQESQEIMKLVNECDVVVVEEKQDI